jgi:hypothetical protein
VKIANSNTRIILFITALWLLAIQNPAWGESPSHAGAAQEQYLALPLTKNINEVSDAKILDRYGVPFIEGTLPIEEKGAARVDLGGNRIKRIFLLGMTYTKPSPWSHLRDSSMSFFIGDELGRIRLDYADGSTQVFPLILGEGIWWGRLFYDNPEPFSTDARFREALTKSLRLYPPTPVEDANYVAVINPKPAAIQSITLEAPSLKWGFPVIAGITIESAESHEITGAVALPHVAFSPEFEQFASNEALRPLGQDDDAAQMRLDGLRRSLYSSDEDYKGPVAVEMPPGYAGPTVSFKGNITADILANAFHYNLKDMADKVDEDGFYHTSTKDALEWGGYNGFGTFRKNVGVYYGDSWTRDMGRSLQELAELGYMNEALHCADYCLRTARLWEDQASLKFEGQFLPRHWGRIANKPGNAAPFENDGHGLTTMFLYKLWQRAPNRDAWLRSRWVDVKAAGDWILWQFDHPEISGSANGVLHTTGESAPGSGHSVYADYVCMEALQALAQMADSIGETKSAGQWRDRANNMRQAIARQYMVTDPKYGRVWTLTDAGWPDKVSMLGPLIFPADYYGFAPEDGDPELRTVNEATYQRFVDTHRPFGFYGRDLGYGQGFATQSALLLDRMHDATRMLEWTAKEVYDPRSGSFIAPEGVQIDETGRFWFRIGDLGNGVQEAEVIKALRIMIGVDDTQPNRLQFLPRMPYGWNEMAVEKYPVLFERSGKAEMTHLRYKLERSAAGMKLEIAADQNLGPVLMRLGPFEKQPGASSIRVNGKIQEASVEHSGDSWWVRFSIPVGPVADR